MKSFVLRMLPRGWFEWLILPIVAYAYVRWAIQLLLEAETIRYHVPSDGWSIAERVMAFPTFYFGVDALTGLVLNALLWGWAASKLSGLILVFIREKLYG